MIVSFKHKDIERLFRGEAVRRFPADIRTRAVLKLQMLNAASRIEALAVPSGNRLEALSGNRAGQHSIRINEQWRICFVWRDGDAHDVEIVDYHR